MTGQGFVSELKFAFLEMKSKQEYVKHIIDSLPPITIAQTDAAGNSISPIKVRLLLTDRNIRREGKATHQG